MSTNHTNNNNNFATALRATSASNKVPGPKGALMNQATGNDAKHSFNAIHRLLPPKTPRRD